MNYRSSFIFVCCQVGAEGALKKELARDYPHLKFAFSRPGFLTFKSTTSELGLDFSLESVFARAYGLSLGQIGTEEISKIRETARSLKGEGSLLGLHVWERDFYPPGEEPLGFIAGNLSGPLEQELRKQDPQLFESSEKAQVGQVILNVIVLDPGKAWMGVHLQGPENQPGGHKPWPGGKPSLALPAGSPSRAYLKLEEALLWSGAPLRSGDTAVEIGSAPGGASFALLNHGLSVVGIDPGEMAPQVLNHPRFRHFQQPVNSILREDLPESIQWVLLDMNVQPQISLFAVDRLVSRMKDSVLGVFLTLKLNQWKIADEIPSLLEHVRAMGMVQVKAAQLAYNRQEITVFGLTRKGSQRSQDRPKRRMIGLKPGNP